MCQKQQQQQQGKGILHTHSHTHTYSTHRTDDLANTSGIFMPGLEIEIPAADFNCSRAKAYYSCQHCIYYVHTYMRLQGSRLIEPHQMGDLLKC